MKGKELIMNDPVYGFITIKNELIRDIIHHPWFQRLRRIKQLGLTEMVYPSANHSRFQHALGAYHLMGTALNHLRSKGVEISEQEYEASLLAILLHDMGHGPFSHALEDTLLTSVSHESLSFLFMEHLNRQFNQALTLSLRIFNNSYHRPFFHQLVSSQLDIDRLDYLNRDCFFTGVQEGVIGVDRILAMLNVHDEKLVIEEKGIYNIENFLQARRLMYWQVYLHKTTLSAERLLVNLIRRARILITNQEDLPSSDVLAEILKSPLNLEDFRRQQNLMEAFGALDDYDVWGAIKQWRGNPDKILSQLAQMLLHRNLFMIKLSAEPIQKRELEKIRVGIAQHFDLLLAETTYFFSHGVVTNEAYTEGQRINILTKKGELLDVAQASELPNIKALTKIVRKNYLCWPKNVSL